MDKYEIINLDMNEFESFLENDYTGEILNVFDSEGIEILKKCPNVKDKINYVLSFSEYSNNLLKTNIFLDFLLSTDISYYYASLSNLNDDTYEYIINRCIVLGKDDSFICKIYNYFSDEYKLKSIDSWRYSSELLYEAFKNNMELLGPMILKKYDINLLRHDINIERLFEVGKILSLKNFKSLNCNNGSIQTLDIPNYMINKDLAEHLWDKYNIYRCRKILNDACYFCDPSLLNEYIKSREDEIVKGFDDGNLLKPFNEIYLLSKRLNELENSDEYYDIRLKWIRLLNSLDDYISDKISAIPIRNLDKLYECLYEISNNSLSNYIIDYHFQENYHNIMYDIRELLNFYYAGNINLTDEKRDLYFKIANIDYLSIDEKKELHEEMKKYNIMEMFYDDMSLARHIVRSSICDNALTKKELLEYRDEELSLEYGVDVYNISDNPFVSVVKTGSHMPDMLPVGHSYSLVGTGCIAVFGDVNKSSTFLYDAEDLNPDQIVHIFPRDSFTFYRPFNSVDIPTRRIEPLMMNDELLHETSFDYNELLILEAGRSETDIDKSIPKLKKMALFCLDKIKSGDIESAKINGVGIALINSSKQKVNIEMPSSIYRHNIEYYDYNYFDGISNTEKHEKNR